MNRLSMRARTVFGWVLSLALLIGIAGPLFGTCTQGDDDPWLAGLFVFAPLGLAGLAMAASGARLGRRYSLFAIPHIATLMLGAQFIPSYFSQTTIKGVHVCSVRAGGGFEDPASLAQQLWAPSWFMVSLVLVYVVFLFWRSGHVTRNLPKLRILTP
jgi:hypothetical protein